jgi:hypothetical protein
VRLTVDRFWRTVILPRGSSRSPIFGNSRIWRWVCKASSAVTGFCRVSSGPHSWRRPFFLLPDGIPTNWWIKLDVVDVFLINA